MYMKGLENSHFEQKKNNQEKPPEIIYEADPVDDFYQSIKKKVILQHKYNL